MLGPLSVLLLGERSIERAARSSPRPRSRSAVADRPAAGRTPAGATEVYPLTIFALGGMMLFVAANDLLTMFVALEVFSLPLYLLCALARRRRLLSPGGGAQVLPARRVRLGVLPLRRGPALRLRRLRPTCRQILHGGVGAARTDDRAALRGLALLAIGLLFKVAAAPFHVWTPDVYQGAPTPVTALMAACTKVAAFGALLRVLYVAFDRPRWDSGRCSG